MRRIIATSVIFAYLGALSCGLGSQVLGIGGSSHPGMYYVLWDMFCGWSGYEIRGHLIAEGSSGTYYRLTPAPWGEFQPYGSAERIDYDGYANHSNRIAQNILSRTDHEPIRRVYFVEESWSKRYNRPDYVWNREFEEPKEPHSYFYARAVYDGQGELLEKRLDWSSAVVERDLASDPRLAKIRQQSRPIFMPNPVVRQSYHNSPTPGLMRETGSPQEHQAIQPVGHSIFVP